MAHEFPLNAPTPSAAWPPNTGARQSPHEPTLIAWSADRGWISSEHPASPETPPPDAVDCEVVLP